MGLILHYIFMVTVVWYITTQSQFAGDSIVYVLCGIYYTLFMIDTAEKLTKETV